MKDIDSLKGKVLLIGISFIDNNEELIEQIQVYGEIAHINGDGITITRGDNGAEFTVPPDFENIHKANPGEYTLRSTGEVVVDPDYLSSWSLHCADREKIAEYTKKGFIGYER